LNNLEVVVAMVQNLPEDQRVISLQFAQDALLKKVTFYTTKTGKNIII